MSPASETKGWGSAHYGLRAAEAARRAAAVPKADREESSDRRAALRRQVYGTVTPYRGRTEPREFEP